MRNLILPQHIISEVRCKRTFRGYSPNTYGMNLCESIKQNNMNKLTIQKKTLKNEVYEILESLDLSGSPTIEEVDRIIYQCGKKVSKILSHYLLSWNSIREQRDGVISDLSNKYPNLSKTEIKRLVVDYIKEYWGSYETKKSFGMELTSVIQIEDTNY